MNIWKPLSRRKPSTTSVRTRPPTPSEASRRRKGMPEEWRNVAAERPERPPPMMMAVLGSLRVERVAGIEVLARVDLGRREKRWLR